VNASVALKRIARDSDPLAAIGGTGSGLPAAARMAYLWGKDPKDGDRGILAGAKWNLRDKPPALEFEFDVEELDDVGQVMTMQQASSAAAVSAEEVTKALCMVPAYMVPREHLARRERERALKNAPNGRVRSEIGEIERFSSPEKLTGHTGLCPRVNQSGESDRRGPLTKHGTTYLRWALLEATMHSLKHPAYAER
jgi:hypothetical protein